jgi:hypothetical protein
MSPTGPLLDCIFVRPECARQGLATALATRLVNSLVQAGESQLSSCAMLANEPSLAWHHRFGFREVADVWVASCRGRFYEHELERHRELDDLSAAQWAMLTELAAHWRAEVERLAKLNEQDFLSTRRNLA